MVRDHRMDVATWATGWVRQVVGDAKSGVCLLAREVRRTFGTTTNEAYRSFVDSRCLGALIGAKLVVSEPD